MITILLYIYCVTFAFCIYNSGEEILGIHPEPACVCPFVERTLSETSSSDYSFALLSHDFMCHVSRMLPYCLSL